MPAVLLPNGKQQFFTTPGVPAVGYKLATFAAGTSAPQATWADALQVGANANPIILDARGEAVIFWSGAYKVQLQDSTGAVIWTVDNVTSIPNLIPPIDNSLTLGSPAFSYANLYLGPNHAPAFDAVSGNIGYYARTAAETAAGVTPSDFSYPPGNPNRYATKANWSAVYAQITSLARYSDGWYRGDRAQHYLLNNCIVGFETMDDSQYSAGTGTAGFNCNAFGALALSQNGLSQIAGGDNVAYGSAALQHNIEGSGNTAIGNFTLNVLSGTPGVVTGSNSHNVAVGHRALSLLANGVSNTGLGFQALNTLGTGNNNMGVGVGALLNLVNGNSNIMAGVNCGFSKTAGDYTHGYGHNCLFSEASAVISGISIAASAIITLNTVTFGAIHPFLAGSLIVVEGITVGMTQINGVIGQVTAIGGAQGAWTVTTNINSLAFTPWSAGGQLSPVGNSCFGYLAAFNLDYSGGNTIMGYAAASAAAPGVNNCLYGQESGKLLNRTLGGGLGSYNVAIGYQTLLRATSAGNCTIVGQEAGSFITSGVDNVCIGSLAGLSLVTNIQNVLVGSLAGNNLAGDSNTAVGYQAGSTGSAQTYTNTASFGNGATPTGSNQVTLGNTSIATIRAQVTTITAISDERFKKNIATLDIPDAFLDEVQVVAYEWISEGMPPGVQMGVIAQQLDALQEKYGLQWLGLVDHSNPDRLEATPGKLLFPLIQRVQKQETRLKAIEARLGL